MRRWLSIVLAVFLSSWLPVSQKLALVPTSASPVPMSPVRAVTGSGEPTASTEHPTATNQTVLVISAAPARRADLLTGEQYDPDLGFYYLRARYSNPDSGRFWTMDSYEGSGADPLSLHKYLYAKANSIDAIDPSGHTSMMEISSVAAISNSLEAMYNGGVSAVGSALQASIFGIQAGKGMNEILMGFILDETGLRLAVDAFQALRGYFQDDEVADLAIFYQHFDAASLPLLVEDSDYAPTDLDQQEPQCFVAGTMVLTEQGLKAIETIKAGDQVWAYDVASSNRVLKPVVKTFIRHRQDWIKLQINEETVEVTAEHPFFIPGKGWVAAASLKVGDKLLAFDAENEAHVRGIERLPGAVTVYNFEVQDLHDYFITNEGILVHNLGAGIHHFLTRALGSKLPYGHRILRAAGKLSAIAHTALHKALNQHLRTWSGGNMMPSRANPGALIRQAFSRNERLKALSQFYRNYDGGRYWKSFQNELKAMVQKGGGGLDPNLFQ